MNLPPRELMNTSMPGRDFIGRAFVVIGGGLLLQFILIVVVSGLLIISAIQTAPTGPPDNDSRVVALFTILVPVNVYILLSSIGFSSVGFAVLGIRPLSQKSSTSLQPHTRVILGLIGGLAGARILYLLSTYASFSYFALTLNLVGIFAGLVGLALFSRFKRPVGSE